MFCYVTSAGVVVLVFRICCLCLCVSVIDASFSLLLLFFFNDTATTEIYTILSSAASDVYKRQLVVVLEKLNEADDPIFAKSE